MTFVDNHDTQRGQALESTVEEWFKPAAYALILLRQDGLPCVFYGDYYGISGQYAQQDFKEVLDRLLAIRKDLAYGEQNDYFDDANCIGWVRSGAENQSPIAVLISNDQENSKSMFVGQEWANQTFVDLLENHQGQVTIDEEGYGQFSSLNCFGKCLGSQYNLIANDYQARSNRIWLFCIHKKTYPNG